MNKVYKAEPRIIQLGEIAITVYQLPDGSYCLSQTEVTGVIEKLTPSIHYYRNSNRFKSLPTRNLSLPTFYVQGSNKPISPVSLELAALYWQHWDAKGNPAARLLVNALIKRSLKDLADEVFEVKVAPLDRQAQLAEDLSVESADRLSTMTAYLEAEPDYDRPEELEKLLERKFSLQVQQLIAHIQNIQSQLNKIQAQQITQPRTYSTHVVIDSRGTVNRESGISHSELGKELGIEDVDELNALLTKAGFDVTSGYWHFAKTVTPILPFEHYAKVKASLLAHLKRNLEY